MSHPLNQPNGELPVSSSPNMDITTHHMSPTPEGRKPYVAPRALYIPAIVQDFKKAAQNALEAGFDGVELHGANGYLIEQFLQDGINDRTDRYGGSVESRARFMFEVLNALLDVVDSSRVGIRLSPYGMSFGQGESNPIEMYGYVLKKSSGCDLAYAHLVEPRSFPSHENPDAPSGKVTAILRPLYKGVLFTASDYEREIAIKAVEDGNGDVVVFGRFFISNPDLPKRLQPNTSLNPYNPDTFYTPGPVGSLPSRELDMQTGSTGSTGMSVRI